VRCLAALVGRVRFGAPPYGQNGLVATRRRQYENWSDEAEELRVGLVAAAIVLGLALLVASLIVPDDWSLVAIPGAVLLGAALVVLAIVAWRGRRVRAALEDASAERAIALVLAVIAAGAAVAVVAVALARDDVAPADLADVLWPLVVLIFGLLAVAALLLWRRPAAGAGRVDLADADTLAGPAVSGAPAVADGVRVELGDARVQLQARAALLGEPVLPPEPSLALARFLQGPLVEALAAVRSGLLAAYAVAVSHPQSQERIATVNRLLEHQATLAQALPARLDDVARRRSNVEGAWAAWEAAARDVTGLVVEASRFLDRVWAGQPEPGEQRPAPSPAAPS
jgi:hypothetical protein